MAWQDVLSIISGAAAVIFAFLAFRRNDTNDERAEAQQQGAILTELGYIKGGVDDIKAEQREQRKFNTNITQKLAEVEAQVIRAHARIERLERHEDTKK